jgi:hypothetical protein
LWNTFSHDCVLHTDFFGMCAVVMLFGDVIGPGTWSERLVGSFKWTFLTEVFCVLESRRRKVHTKLTGHSQLAVYHPSGASCGILSWRYERLCFASSVNRFRVP